MTENDLQKQLKQQDQDIKALQSKIHNKDQKIDELKKDIAESADQIADLKKQIKDLTPAPVNQDQMIVCKVKARSKGQIRHRLGHGFNSELKTVKIKQANLLKLKADPELIVEVLK